MDVPRSLLVVSVRLLVAAAPLLLSLLSSLGAAGTAWAQGGDVHYRHHLLMPPGAIGNEQLLRGGPLPGYFQPVQIKVPRGAQISVAVDGSMDPPQPGPRTVGMLIGAVYRLKVSSIPFHEGFEVFPTVEVINRLYPPRGLELYFPIPIEITQEELEYALQGRFVTRVIYLEPSELALPVPEDPQQQRYFEVRADQDPLKVADQLGRPMAILRLGSRIPSPEEAGGRFTFGSPPLMIFPAVEQLQTPAPTKPPVPATTAALPQQVEAVPASSRRALTTSSANQAGVQP